MTMALAIAALAAVGTWLLVRGGGVRLVLGFILLGHAVNLLIISAGGTDRRTAPLLGQSDVALLADPLPQAFVLTAIVITFGVTVYLVSLVTRTEGDSSRRRPAADLDPDASNERPDGEER
ncbi:MAG: sodium:proton antiporter [Actinomycetota bacterium]|nr:sodium:proton antiporter [Actinomycetota bacterium]